MRGSAGGGGGSPLENSKNVLNSHNKFPGNRHQTNPTENKITPRTHLVSEFIQVPIMHEFIL